MDVHGAALRTLGELDVDIDDASLTRVLKVITPLAEKYQLTAYDATYLELARPPRPAAVYQRRPARDLPAEREGVRLGWPTGDRRRST